MVSWRSCRGGGVVARETQPLSAAADVEMNAVAVILKPIDHGWAVALTDGRELARFTGLAAKWRATRYLAGRDFGQDRQGMPEAQPSASGAAGRDRSNRRAGVRAHGNA